MCKTVSSKLKNSHVMVTGGCGFIGSHLVKQLKYLGVDKITVIDSMQYGKKENLGEYADQVNIIKHTLGREDNKVLPDALHGVDYLFHLAAQKHNQAIDNPQEVISSNIVGTFNLLNYAAISKVKKVVFTSSLYAYGRMTDPAFKESDVPVPHTVYGISKLTGEHLVNHFFRKCGMYSAILRYLFVYGPGQFAGTGYKSVIVKNFERILKDRSPVIFGDGNQVLDYIYIGDVVNITIKIMESDIHNEIFNIGSAIPISINELIDHMLKISGKDLKKQYDPPDSTHGSFRVADISKIKEALGFKPSVSIEEGLKETYNWIKGEVDT